MEESRFIGHLNWQITSRTPKPVPQQLHTAIFSVKQRGTEKIHELLLNISDPFHESYGKYLTRNEIGELTSNWEYTNAALSVLRAIDRVEITEVSIHGEYITATAPVKIWEILFRSKFYLFSHENVKAARMPKYHMPPSLSPYIGSVFNLVDFPFSFQFQFSKEKSQSNVNPDLNEVQFQPPRAFASTPTPYFVNSSSLIAVADPAYINFIHNISNNTGNNLGSQLVYSTISQSYSKADLSSFQTFFGLPLQQPISSIGGHVFDGPCSNATICAEANLDIQWLMALSQSTPTTVYYDENSDGNFLSFITTMANFNDPPLVICISYGTLESTLSDKVLEQWNLEAQKLGVQGVTIICASGDSGVSGYFMDPKYCGYGPIFPASSPYVTTVGSLQPKISVINKKFTVTGLRASQSDLGGAATSGGGFSQRFPTPSWQKNAVTNYFSSLTSKPANFSFHNKSSFLPLGTYNAGGRGYPDVSAWGAYVWVTLNKKLDSAAGTSVSAPIVGGMVSLLNANRLARGLPSLGFLNPLLYGNNRFIQDITSGNNSCLLAGYNIGKPAPKMCCRQGFLAGKGWDPVTGLGAINFRNFKAALLPQNSSMHPSQVLTRSIMQTKKQTQKPTQRQTKKQTQKPSLRQTKKYDAGVKNTQKQTPQNTHRLVQKITTKPTLRVTLVQLIKSTMRPSLKQTLRPIYVPVVVKHHNTSPYLTPFTPSTFILICCVVLYCIRP